MQAKTLDELLADLSVLTGDKAKLKTGAALPTDLVGAANTIADLTARVAALEGDKAKLVQGATLPTDLVTAANAIATLTKERDDAAAKVSQLEGEKLTVDKAVAAKLVELGITDGKKAGEAGKAGDVKLTATQKVLKAKGLPLDTKIDLTGSLVGGTVTGTEISE